MINGISIFLNTHSSCKDLWPMFFAQLRKHWPSHPPLVIAVDRLEGAMEDALDAFYYDGARNYAVREYNSDHGFGQQYLQGLSYVTTDYVLPLLEDMILYDAVDEAAIQEAMQPVAVNRLVKTRVHQDVKTTSIGPRWETIIDGLSLQPTVWPTERLLAYSVLRRKCSTPWDWERHAGSKHPFGEPGKNGPKRGRAHWDSLCFPAILTALNKGKWNLSEYPGELGMLLNEFKIDPLIRGAV